MVDWIFGESGVGCFIVLVLDKIIEVIGWGSIGYCEFKIVVNNGFFFDNGKGRKNVFVVIF